MTTIEAPKTTPKEVTTADVELPWIQGECPRGCGRTLFVGTGGYVTCSWLHCPEPDAAHSLLRQAAERSRETQDD